MGIELRRLLADPALASRRGDAAFAAVAAQHGAVRQTLDLVARLVSPQSDGRGGNGGR